MNNLIKKFLIKGDVHLIIVEMFILSIFLARGLYIISALYALFIFVSLYYKLRK